MTRCPSCGLPLGDGDAVCSACRGVWEIVPLVYPAVPLYDEGRDAAPAALGEMLAALPTPAFVEFAVGEDGDGLEVWLGARPGALSPMLLRNWAGRARHRVRPDVSRRTTVRDVRQRLWVLLTPETLPHLDLQQADPSALAVVLRPERRLRVWLLGRDERLQRRLRALSTYNYTAEGGVDDDTPNPWGWRLRLYRSMLLLGGGLAAVGGGFVALGRAWPGFGLFAAGGMLFLGGLLGQLDWFRMRSVPREWMERAVRSPLLEAAFTVHDAREGLPPPPTLVPSGRWIPARGRAWPGVRRTARAYPAEALAVMLRPPHRGDPSALFAADFREDAPAPPPTAALRHAPLLVGRAVATGEPVGIDPDGHGLVVGGSGTGKSSSIFALLRSLVRQGDDAPGLFLVDPHLSLADAFLAEIDRLPPERRAAALERLVVIAPGTGSLVPLNLLAIPDWTWASNALISLGQRIWRDYWGPRMQATLDALFRIGVAWNRARPDAPLGLVHLVFLAFNTRWRRDALQYMPPAERASALALDALLGQVTRENPTSWTTEVVSPIVSKVMGLELSPWLFAALHQDRFVDMARWIRERYWIVVRPETGRMGRPAAELTAALLYNIFESMFRETVRAAEPVPFYVVVDEAQEIAAGMRLEQALAEGRKFGIRLFVLAQSLAMMRAIPEFEPVVQALLANTSTRFFFSPDPGDLDDIEAVLGKEMRYGPSPASLPSLVGYLHARIRGRWQPPTLVRVRPLPQADHDAVMRVIRDAEARHPDDYIAIPEGQGPQATLDAMLHSLEQIAPPALQPLLRTAFEGHVSIANDGADARQEDDRLGL